MNRAPKQSLLFRTVTWLARLQLAGRLRRSEDHHLPVVLFAMLAGAAALGTITLAAWVTDLPLLFPPLAPSAFIIFYTPMAVTASPRNVVMAHTMAVLSGLFALNLLTMIFPTAGLADPAVMNWQRVLVITLAMGLITVLMAGLRCAHPPAAASALIAAMGYLAEPLQSAGLCAAAILLVLEAILLNRVIGGMPYPLWRTDPEVARNYGALAGLAGAEGGYWQQLSARIIKHH